LSAKYTADLRMSLATLYTVVFGTNLIIIQSMSIFSHSTGSVFHVSPVHSRPLQAFAADGKRE